MRWRLWAADMQQHTSLRCDVRVDVDINITITLHIRCGRRNRLRVMRFRCIWNHPHVFVVCLDLDQVNQIRLWLLHVGREVGVELVKQRRAWGCVCECV
jgi:hypothetical protein